jgi:hypothetical protein
MNDKRIDGANWTKQTKQTKQTSATQTHRRKSDEPGSLVQALAAKRHVLSRQAKDN